MLCNEKNQRKLFVSRFQPEVSLKTPLFHKEQKLYSNKDLVLKLFWATETTQFCQSPSKYAALTFYQNPLYATIVFWQI